MTDKTEKLGRAAHDAIQRLVRERLARKPGGHLIEASLDEIELPLRLALAATEAGAKRFTEQLIDEIDRLLDDAVEQAAAFRPGHAYCHRCESVSCEHSTPRSSRHVFIGYAPTGLPRWEDFAQYCLDQKHPQVDRLYHDPPALAILVQGRDDLRAGMLEAFENPSYELLSQLVAGFFPVRARAEEGRGVLALTIQVASSRGSRGDARLGLNVLGRSPSGGHLDRLWERHDDLVWRRSVAWAQSTLQTIATSGAGRRRRVPAAELQRRVDGIMHSLARRLQRDGRARSRRTRHAEKRHASGSRPTSKALDDARGASAETLLVDERSGTLVVLGQRGRTHFFTPEGRLVSSVRYSREAIERKLRAEVWRRVSDEQLRAFGAKIS